MTVFEGIQKPREFKLEAFSSEQNDLHPIIIGSPTIILPPELKNLKFSVFHELEMKSGRMDFLYIFEDGTILLAEIKLSRNQEIKRTVVAQLLDYASDIRQMTSKGLIALLKKKEGKLQDFLTREAFEKKLARGMQKKIIMEIVTDDNVEDLHRIFGFIGGEMSNVSICLAEIRKYSDSGKYFLEVNIRYPESGSPTDITRISIEEFVGEFGKKYATESQEIQKFVGTLPNGWGLQCGSEVVFIFKNSLDNRTTRFVLNLNLKKTEMTLWGKPSEYAKIVSLFKGDNYAPPSSVPSSEKTSFIIVRFPCKGITMTKMSEILNKLDSLG